MHSTTYFILLVHDDIFEEPIEGRFDVSLLVHLLAHGENPSVIEEQLPPFPGESFAARIRPRKVIAGRTAN